MSTQILEDSGTSSNTETLDTNDSVTIDVTETVETVTEPEAAPEPKTKAPEAEKPKLCTLHAKGELLALRALLKVEKKSTIELLNTQIIILEKDGVEHHFKRIRI